MARTLIEIHDKLKQDFVDNSTIQTFYGLTPGNTFDQEFSIVSFEGILFYIIAFSIWVLEKNFDELETKVDEKIQQSRYWNLQNFVEDAYNFQLGDDLVFHDGKYQYAAINPALKIINIATASEVSNGVLLKIAKFSAGTYQPLEVSEIDTFAEYASLVKPPGVPLTIISRPADDLKIYYHIYLNSLVFNADGSLISQPTIKPVENVINAYCKELPFDGVFNITALTDKIQAVSGVNAPVFDSAEAKFGTLDYAPIIDFYNPNSGYLTIDSDFPLSLTITYIMQ